MRGEGRGTRILLLGGTSETAPLATALAEAGYLVLVSTATDIPLDTGQHARIRKRTGGLDAESLAALAQAEGIRAIVDAAHPYATAAHLAAGAAAGKLRIPCLTYVRPSGLPADACVPSAATHEEAARLACEAGGPILLTTGSRNIAPYANAARSRGSAIFVRVLPVAESRAACRAAGVPEENIIAGRGPFSLADNRALIRKLGIKTLVTKDSGAAGGLAEKLEAARLENCRVIIVRRPPSCASETFGSISELVQALAERL
ncbi:MAG: precorrin-6A reductase [Planctomycetota bacterium]